MIQNVYYGDIFYFSAFDCTNSACFFCFFNSNGVPQVSSALRRELNPKT